jgi:Bacterial capsule synthesis protein PGA_cap
MRRIKLGIVCLLTATLFMLACSANRQIMESASTENEQVEIAQETINFDAIDEFFAQDLIIEDDVILQSNVKIVATGDLMLGTRYPDESYLPEISGYKLFGKKVKRILESGDVTFGNLEGAISGIEGIPKKKKYVFAMPDEAANWLQDAGYNLLSLANNHAGDMSEAGCLNTINKLIAEGINFAGLKENPTTEFKRNGIKYGFLAVSPNYGVAYLHDTEWIKEQVEELSLKNDIVIVSMHIGAEGAKHQHITRKTEKYLGENRGDPYKFAREVIDAGADLVLGHGPHVTRAIDLYKDRFIAYSMGNFCTISRVNLSGVNGIAPILQLELTHTGEFVLGRIYSTIQYARTGVRMDEEEMVLQKIIELTKEDFPESSLVIMDNGLIIPK